MTEYLVTLNAYDDFVQDWEADTGRTIPSANKHDDKGFEQMQRQWRHQ